MGTHISDLVNVQGCQTGQVILLRVEAIPVSRLSERELLQNLLLHKVAKPLFLKSAGQEHTYFNFSTSKHLQPGVPAS